MYDKVWFRSATNEEAPVRFELRLQNYTSKNTPEKTNFTQYDAHNPSFVVREGAVCI